MKASTFEYRSDSGWTVDSFPSVESDQSLVVVFGDRRFLEDQEPLHELVDAYPNSHVVGCSTSGEINGTRLSDETLSVCVMSFDDTEVIVADSTIPSGAESFDVGVNLARQLNKDGLSKVLVLSNGLAVNGTKLMEGMNSELGDDVVVTGGLAGDGEAFERTWVMHGDDVAVDKTVAVGFCGDNIIYSHGSQGGWDRFGPERRVTKSSDNVLYELDDQPALDLYKRYLGDHADELPAAGLLFPLEVHHPDRPDRRLVRTILAVDEDANSLTFAGDIPEGWIAQLMKANFDRLVEGAEEAAERAKQMESHDGDVVCFAISCVGRRLVLQERTEDELDAIADRLPEETQIVGFYSYGELSPFIEGEACNLHNQTMTITVVSESV